MIPTAESVTTIPLQIPIGGRTYLDADVAVPAHAKGVVLFAHGSGSSRHSPRNRYVASQLNFVKLATVLADLLTPEEEVIDDRTRELRFDIGMLTHRMIQVVDWVRTYGPIAKLPVGVFGASTGAAAALDAAAARPALIRAVVSRGGRPDLAVNIGSVMAPTLLIVGGDDHTVVRLNQDAYRRLTGIRELEVVPGATHLFEEPGTLERVADVAGAFFLRHLPPHELR
jgi:pimeloyl-ACP methyl ester carboxylesterase